MKNIVICIAFTLMLNTINAQEIMINFHETAGISRENEPVFVKGEKLFETLGNKVNTRCLRVTDQAGQLIPIQIDERDNQLAFQKNPNHILDANDEVVWQCSIPALGTKTFKVFTVKSPEDSPSPDETELHAGSNNESRKNFSATMIMENGQMEVGVRGWPKEKVDKEPYGGHGKGMVTMLRIFGTNQIYQNEAWGFVLNSRNLLDGFYDKLELIAAKGPIRTILQCTGSITGEKQKILWGGAGGTMGAWFMCVRDAKIVRTYSLYNRIPLLEFREELKADWIDPSFCIGGRFYWREGGYPFNPETKLYVPAENGNTIDSISLDLENCTAIQREFPQDAWVCAIRPDDKGVPAFFFDPSKIWKFKTYMYEPWGKKHFKTPAGKKKIKSFIDFYYNNSGINENTKKLSWSWYVWGTKTQNPKNVQQMYQAWIKRPLHTCMEIATENPLNIPKGAIEQLEADLNRQKKRLEKLKGFADDKKLQNVIKNDYAECTQLIQAFKNDWHKLDNKSKKDFIEEFSSWQNKKENPSLAFQQLDFFTEKGLDNGYRVLVTDNCHKIFKTLRCPGMITQSIELESARREAESIQLAVVPIFKSLSNVNIEISNLDGPDGNSIKSSCWRKYLVEDIKPPPGINKKYGKPENTRWSDPLFPFKPFNCPADKAQAVLLTIDVPVDIHAGVYKGKIKVEPEGLKPTVLSLKLKVFDFTLPEKRSMFWDCWFSQDQIARFYGYYCRYNPEALEIYKKNIQMLSLYRAVPGWNAGYAVYDYVDIWKEDDGNFTFDFSRLDPWIALSQKFGNLWNPNFSCCVGWLHAFNHQRGYKRYGSKMVRDRKTGERIKDPEKILDKRSSINPTYSLLYEKFIQAFVKHLKEKGWLESAWFEQWDECNKGRIPKCKEHHPYMMKIVPELQLMWWGLRPKEEDWGISLTHAIAPNLKTFKKLDELSLLNKYRQTGNKKIFAYTCGAGYQNPDRNIMIPDINIWDPNIQRRVYAWLYHKMKLDGMLIFTMIGWAPDNLRKKTPQERWPEQEWIIKSQNTYYLVYPSPEGTLWPSLRLDALRDGLEDYEYIHAAKKLLKTNPDPKLEKLLEIDKSIILNLEHYALDPKVYNKRRAAIAGFLEKHK